MSLQSIRSAIKAEYDYYHHPCCKLFVVCLLSHWRFLLLNKKKMNMNIYLIVKNNLLIN